jgi:hypothetical protein
MAVMMENKPEIVISKKDAVFWMDGNGCWRNAHGRFQHKKVIQYFHSAIRKDDRGYYVSQDRGDVVEKVYFPYEETALFVFDVIVDGDIVLVLNTGRRFRLEPDRLYVNDDILFVRTSDEVAKFTDRSMMKIVRFIEERDGRLSFVREAVRHTIQQRK